VAERFADGEATPDELDQAQNDANKAFDEQGDPHPHRYPSDACNSEVFFAVENITPDPDQVDYHELSTRAMPIIEDVIGNSFVPITLDPKWLTPTVVALARGIYTERASDRLPILADALQDAGCENADILDHCRGLGPHVRGCWVVDMMLGKT
jgi:hypothetical protein